MKAACIIPARFQSSRFPGKPLAEIQGYPMIRWVYERALAADVFVDVLIATDDERIVAAVTNFSGQAVMTPSDLPSGTDRVAFVAENMDVDVIINLQGDEPLVRPELLRKLCSVFDNDEVLMATPVKRVSSGEALFNPNLARVVVDKNGNALYFTRAVIPFNRDEDEKDRWQHYFDYLQHIGIYAYRKDFLLKFARLPEGNLEKIEKLEQLRVLEHGFPIRTVMTDYDSMSVDTPEDLVKLNNYIQEYNLNVKP